MIPTLLLPLANHLWQSTLFVVFAGLLTLALRKHRASARHWIWLAASVKFLVPFSVLVVLGQQVRWQQPAPGVQPGFSIVMDKIGRPFTASLSNGALGSSTPTGFDAFPGWLSLVFIVLWACGFCVTASVWFLRWRRIREIQSKASPLNLGLPIPARTTSERLEPGVFGIFRPVLLLPSGITERLAPPQMNALLAHELCHVRRRDNMAIAVHSLVEAFFWFHPLVWWIENRMIAEQERACDEEVLMQGHSPEAYAEGILKVCEFYVGSPLPGVSGIGGSDLKQRIRAIMIDRPVKRLSRVSKTLLLASGLLAVLLPVFVGVAMAPPIQAQGNAAPGPRFEVVTIKPTKPESDVVWGVCQGTDGGPYSLGRARPASPGLGRCRVTGLTLKMLVGMAYDYREPKTYAMEQQIVGGPDWVKSIRFDIEAKAENPSATTAEQIGQMFQQLLADRFKLRFHRDMRNVPGYRLVVAKNGSKLEKVTDPEAETRIGGHPVHGGMSFRAASLNMLTEFLSMGLGGTVQDKTGLTGKYNFTVEFSPSEHEAAFNGPQGPAAPIVPGPSLVGALQDQLGLKLESAKVPMPVLVIDSAAKPKED